MKDPDGSLRRGLQIMMGKATFSDVAAIIGSALVGRDRPVSAFEPFPPQQDGAVAFFSGELAPHETIAINARCLIICRPEVAGAISKRGASVVPRTIRNSISPVFTVNFFRRRPPRESIPRSRWMEISYSEMGSKSAQGLCYRAGSNWAMDVGSAPIPVC